ncbi:hypothetical protein CYMTET_31389 [Cymbomonas tetramitiformis]|uniref:Arginine deiminase n=1 Tax=Cymbomonas tetramitiformis TaxID=36881 RepID=A0AAE0KT07_9CHLO|nr:hypothetical protein CYMTET_31389 [Cymbomonas tetramitiformis]
MCGLGCCQRDEFEQCQDRMHLDCLFNILDEDLTVLAEDVMPDKDGNLAEFRRMVDEYEFSKDRSCAETGHYYLKRRGVEFTQYLTENGFGIIPVSRKHQLEYGCNVLNLGNGNILACHKEASRAIVKDPRFKGKVQLLDFASITAMYGGLHCSSQVVKRSAV